MLKTKRIKLKTHIKKPNIKRLIKKLRKETRGAIKDAPNIFDWYSGLDVYVRLNMIIKG